MTDLEGYRLLREIHPGWCTIESEPAIFNQILRDAGVPNTQVSELYSLDDEIVNELGPIIGLIFLCRWREDMGEQTQEAEANCPSNVWFANQISENSCASLAMLNILFNAETVLLGDELSQFKSFTNPLTPPLRGLCLQNFEFLRKIHNSFARRSEILQNNMDTIVSCKTNKDFISENASGLEAGYHFVAYVPSGGSVWELDGLRRQPVSLGDKIDSKQWLLAAVPRIQHQISKYSDDEMMFTLLAITKTSQEPEGRSWGLEFNKTRNDITARGDTGYPYATRVKHPYVAFMRRYIQLLADRGLQVGV